MRVNVLEQEESVRYQLLDRMKQDVEYVIRQVEASKEDAEQKNWSMMINNIFWGGQSNHFSTMKDLFGSFSEEKQPDWYSLSQMYAQKRHLEELVGFELG